MNNIADFNAEGTDLRKHQLIMLDMLVYFDSICKENNISYWLSSGNLLGAVRHKGFIPWDDDLDVEMMRKDYLKLEKILAKDPRYIFQTRKNDYFYTAPYAKFRDKKTKITEHGQDANYKYKGIYMDVFYLEYSNQYIAKIYAILMWRILLFGSKAKNFFESGLFFVMKKALYFSLPITRLFSKLIPGKKLRHAYGAGFIDMIRHEDRIFPLTKIQFEGLEFPAPKDVDFYLTSMYGDYMTLPDINKIPKHLTEIEFLD